MTRIFLLSACLLTFVALPSISNPLTTYRERTGAGETYIYIQQDPVPNGLIIRSFMSNGEYYEVEYGASDATVRYGVLSAARKLDYTAFREGNIIRFKGAFGGKPLSRANRIDDHPWFETVEISLRGMALSASRTPLVFWIVQPWEAKAYLMQATNEGEETILVNGASVAALRVRVRPEGILALIWSSLYWYRSSDGLFVRYEAVRGLPGTPVTVVELVAED